MGTPTVDDEVIDLVAEILPAGDYVPLLLEITPRLVYPMSKGDYFAEEQVKTLGHERVLGAARKSADALLTGRRPFRTG